MNNHDFQEACKELKVRYENKSLTDADIDMFADIVSNILSREDLRAKGTDYAILSEKISNDYENNNDMTPLLARMYQICRMYETFRPRPLTEMERKLEAEEIAASKQVKTSALMRITFHDKVIANCWWNDVDGMDGLAKKVALVAPKLIGVGTVSDDDRTKFIIEAFSNADAGIDPLDETSLERARAVMDDVPLAEDKDTGIIALDKDGIERNRMRRGKLTILSLDDERVRMDSFVIYEKGFYKKIANLSVDSEIETFGVLTEDMTSFSFADASFARDKWLGMGEVFAIAGQDGSVGAKRAVQFTGKSLDDETDDNTDNESNNDSSSDVMSDSKENANLNDHDDAIHDSSKKYAPKKGGRYSAEKRVEIESFDNFGVSDNMSFTERLFGKKNKKPSVNEIERRFYDGSVD